ncbi:MAG TPA: hypothetical protein ENH62_07940 [Marinobacter sp.]|nr:hypothetical protein [Marinobacter sp.]
MKKLFLIFMAMLFSSIAFAQPRLPFHQVQIVDERGVTVTSITSVEIYAPDTTTNAVIYSDRGLNNTMTIPITTGSTNTTLVAGVLSWYGPDGYDFSITDGTNIATNADHRTRTASEGTLVFPSYITAISSTTYSDAQTATWGTSGDWTQRGGNVNDQLSFTPLNDNANFIIGVSGTAKNSDFNVYVGTALGFEIDAGNPSLTWDGGAVLLNDASNFNVGICTGTSTGAITLGSSTSGNFVVDTTTSVSINADDSVDITTSEAAATIDIDSAAGNVIIDSGQSAANAVLITATASSGGVILSSGAGGSITLDSGDDIFLAADTGVGDVISFINTQGTAAGAFIIRTVAAGGDINIDSVLGRIEIEAEEDVANALFLIADGGTSSSIRVFNDTGISATDASASIQITSDLGGIELLSSLAAANQIRLNAAGTVAGDAVVLETTDGRILLNADGGSNGDIELNSADDIVLTTAGKLTITNTEAVTISGALTVTGDTQLVSVTRIDTPIEIVAAANEIEITESGTVYILNDGTEFATTLPTVASSAGVTYRFIVGVDPVGTAFTIVTDTLEDKIEGVVVVNGASVGADGPDDTITFTASAAVVGDWVELTSDGVLWYLSGHAVAATGIVPSKAD